MRTTLVIKDDLLRSASEATGIREKTALIHRGLEELVRLAAYERLKSLGGAAPDLKVPPRRRPAASRSRRRGE